MEYRKGSHTIFNLQYHLVWVTKYRYHVLTGEIKLRTREIIRQICMRHELYTLAKTRCIYWSPHYPIYL